MLGLGSSAAEYAWFLYSQRSKFFPPISKNGKKRKAIAVGILVLQSTQLLTLSSSVQAALTLIF